MASKAGILLSENGLINTVSAPNEIRASMFSG